MVIRQVIEDLGGAAIVAGALSAPDRRVAYSTVASWIARENIPAEHWVALVRLAQQRAVASVTFEALALLHAKPQSSAAELRVAAS